MALNKSRSTRSVLLLCASTMIATGFFTTVYAQSSEEAVKFDLPAQSLEQALKSFSVSADKQLMFATDLAEGKTVAGLSGEMEPMQALDVLLNGTGLVYETTSSNVILVKGADGDQRGVSDSKNLNPQPVLMAQNSSQTGTSPTSTTSSQSSENGTSIVTGKVTDARTGANLKGAKVTIEKTGQWTSTNDLGEFRFVNVPMGSATLTVSYLGYAGQSAVVGVRGNGSSQNFALRGGTEMDEIVVFGQRSARALALNQERTASNFRTVLSADLLNRFDGTTVAESLRRAPGIAFQQSDTSGDGTNVIVRGLDADFNMVRLNGLRLPEGSGVARSPQLNNILTETVSNISISKTLLPSQDSAGTGGLIEIETKGPLDYGDRFMSFNARHAWNGNNYRNEELYSAVIAKSFGPTKDFGVSASIQYRENDVQSIRYNGLIVGSAEFARFGQYLPLGPGGEVVTSPLQIDPRTQFPFEDGATELYPIGSETRHTQSNTTNFAATVSAQWRVSEHSNLRLDYTKTEVDSDEFRRRVNFSTFATYTPVPIDELGGETRGALIWEEVLADIGFPGALAANRHSYNVTLGRKDVTDLLNLRGSTTNGQWSFDYSVGFADGERDIPLSADIDLNPDTPLFGLVDVTRDLMSPAALANTRNGIVVSPFAPLGPADRFSQPLLNEAGFALFNDPSFYRFATIGISSQKGSNERETAAFDVQYEFAESPFRYVRFGAFYEGSKTKDVFCPGDSYFGATAAPSLLDLGLDFSQDDLADIGGSGGLHAIGYKELVPFVRGAPNNPLLDGVVERPFDDRNLNTETEEETLDFYLEGRVDIGRLEMVGGVRLNRVEVNARNLTSPTFIDEFGNLDFEFAERYSTLVNQSATQSEPLPRLLLNYRANDNLIFRGGYFMSVARPRLSQLSSNQTIRLDLQPTAGPNDDQPSLTIIEGNPGLKPAYTNNYDLSVEYYDDSLGQLKASIFYKSIENFLEFSGAVGTDQLEGAVLPDDPRFAIENLPDNLFVNRIRPFNNDDDARIWGVELTAERQLTFLPGAWSGLGVFANYTYTDSEKTFFDQFFDPATGELVEVEIDDVPFNQQPKDSGTIAITYNRGSIDASLAYTRQARRFSSWEVFGMHQYFDEDESLDFRAEYFLETAGRGTWRIYAEASDLLKGESGSDVSQSVGGYKGTPKYASTASFFGGRVFRVGFAAVFE